MSSESHEKLDMFKVPFLMGDPDKNAPTGGESLLTSRKDRRNEPGLYIINGFAKTYCADFLVEAGKILDGADVPFSIAVFRSLGFLDCPVGSINPDEVTLPTTSSKSCTEVTDTASKISYCRIGVQSG